MRLWSARCSAADVYGIWGVDKRAASRRTSMISYVHCRINVRTFAPLPTELQRCISDIALLVALTSINMCAPFSTVYEVGGTVCFNLTACVFEKVPQCRTRARIHKTDKTTIPFALQYTNTHITHATCTHSGALAAKCNTHTHTHIRHDVRSSPDWCRCAHTYTHTHKAGARREDVHSNGVIESAPARAASAHLDGVWRRRRCVMHRRSVWNGPSCYQPYVDVSVCGKCSCRFGQ